MGPSYSNMLIYDVMMMSFPIVMAEVSLCHSLFLHHDHNWFQAPRRKVVGSEWQYEVVKVVHNLLTIGDYRTLLPVR